MTPLNWTDWQVLGLAEPLSSRVLAEILDGGQAFRWHLGPDQAWTGVWGAHTAQLRLDGRSRLLWRGPAGQAGATGPALAEYFDSRRAAGALADSLPWRSDPHLARCLEAFPGLRLLRQPLGETLLCFLCSAAKQVAQIKQMAASLAENHGAALLPGGSAGPRRLPTWAELAELPESALRSCRLGFRARHVHGAARFIAARPGWLDGVAAAPYPRAREMLRQLPGVGEKIADCALLFGAGRMEAFPVDVWILRAMAGRYGLEGWKPAQVAHFGRVHFGPMAGLAQQYLFAWERSGLQ